MNLLLQCPLNTDHFIIKAKFLAILNLITSGDNNIGLIPDDNFEWIAALPPLINEKIITRVDLIEVSTWDFLLIRNYSRYTAVRKDFKNIPVISLLLDPKDWLLLHNFPRLVHVLDTNTVNITKYRSSLQDEQIFRCKLKVDFFKIKNRKCRKFAITYVCVFRQMLPLHFGANCSKFIV